MVRKMQAEDAAYLNEYLAEKRLDLYYRCPWTGGCHMCEILHYSIDAGLQLCNSEGRVGAVLHIYNARRQLRFIDNVPLLDDLCKLFQREIFLSSLPTENFSSHFRRFLGGTVQSEAKETSMNTGRLAIGLPVKLSSAGDYVKRLMPGEMSLFYELYNHRFATTVEFWSRVYTGKTCATLAKSQLEGILKCANSPPFTGPLMNISATVLEEFTGRVPMAGIKYHAIYDRCLEILKNMAFLKLQEEDKSVEAASHTLGFSFFETLLVAIVDHRRSAQMSRILPHLSSVRLARQAIITTYADKTLCDFVWKIFGAIRRPHECFDGYHRPHGHLGGNRQP
jgi:hypothetical protein